MIGRILLSAALLASTVSVAQAKYHVLGMSSEHVYAVDVGSIRQQTPYTMAWVTHFIPMDDVVVRAKHLRRFDCVRHTTQIISTIITAPDGSSTNSNDEGELTHIAPRTTYDDMRRAVCENYAIPNLPVLDSESEMTHLGLKTIFDGLRK